MSAFANRRPAHFLFLELSTEGQILSVEECWKFRINGPQCDGNGIACGLNDICDGQFVELCHVIRLRCI